MTQVIASTTADDVESSRQIVVGIDGSDCSKAALAWAAHQAELTGSPLMAVSTWEWPTSYGAPIYWPENIDFEEDARNSLKQSVKEVLGSEDHPDVTQSVLNGHPAPILEDLSRSASLIVVGSRGHGEFAGMLLGSVSEFLATHAHCPIVIVRGVDKDTE